MTYPGADDRIVIRAEDLGVEPPAASPFAPSPLPPLPGLTAAPPVSGYQTTQAPYWSPQPAPSEGTNGMAIASLICGLLGLSLLALIFGYVARGQLRSPWNRQEGGGLATAGIVIGWIGVVIGLVTFIALIALLQAASNSANYGN